MIVLRDFQDDLIGRARQRLREGVRRLLIQLATGGGKTVIAAFIIGGVRARGLRVWFVVHRKELIRQTSATFTSVGIPHGFIAADMTPNPFELVQLCGVQTLAARLDDGNLAPPDVIIWDEAHHATAGTWADVAAKFPNAIGIGLSATPQRLDGAGLRAHFDVMEQGPSTAELIRRGFLSPYRYFAPGEPDLVGVRRGGGDFNRGDLGALLDKPQLVGDVVEHYLRLCPGEQGIVFAVNREHSRHLADAFRAHGVAAAHVDGSMTSRERDRFDAAFRAGDVTVGCNVELFGEGYDVPGIGYVGVARPTTSLSWHRQMLGRGLRTAPGKTVAVLADHAGNAIRGLGLPDDDVEWSLDGKVKGAARGPSDSLPIHTCPTCYQVTASAVRVCPGCGHEFATVARTLATSKGELFELNRLGKAQGTLELEARREREKNEERGASLATLMQLARDRNAETPGRYKDPRKWAAMKIKLREEYARGRRRSAR
jgi:superfamily II DNA or RNA helicase